MEVEIKMNDSQYMSKKLKQLHSLSGNTKLTIWLDTEQMCRKYFSGNKVLLTCSIVLDTSNTGPVCCHFFGKIDLKHYGTLLGNMSGLTERSV